MKTLLMVLIAVLVLAAGVGAGACNPEPGTATTPTATATDIPTPSPTEPSPPSPTPAPTQAPTSAASPSPAPTAAPAAAPEPSPTPAATPTATPTPTATVIPAAAPAAVFQIHGIDDAGRLFVFYGTPKRIVSHVPSITETLFALGLDDRIVGVSDYCNYPEEALSKPSIGGYFTPSIEAIVDLDPDVVFTDGHVAEIAQLDAVGIPFVVVDPKDIPGVLRDIELLGYITGRLGLAQQITSDMRARIDATVETVGNATRARVFYVFDATDPTKPWTAGPGSFVDYLIQLAGGDNIAADAPGAWVQFSMEVLVALDPEIILVDSMHGTAVIAPEVLQELPGWTDTTAVREDRIYVTDGDLINRTGPRIVQGLEQMAAFIHPERFGPQP